MYVIADVIAQWDLVDARSSSLQGIHNQNILHAINEELVAAEQKVRF